MDLPEYTDTAVYEFLNEFELMRTPGAAYGYSNVGAGLLGHALALRAGIPCNNELDPTPCFNELLSTRLTEPLGLSMTVVGHPRGLAGVAQTRLDATYAEGHDEVGQPVPDTEFGILSSATSIFSTGRDLAAWIHARLDPDATPLGPALRRAQTPLFEGAQRLAYHWFMEGAVLTHFGDTAGFTTYIAAVPTEGVGVAVLSDARTYAPRVIGDALLRIMRGGPASLPPPPTEVFLPPAELARFEGSYRAGFSPHIEIVVRPGDDEGLDRLYATEEGQARGLYLFARGPLEFFTRTSQVRLTFVEEAGDVTGFVLTEQGRDLVYRRVQP